MYCESEFRISSLFLTLSSLVAQRRERDGVSIKGGYDHTESKVKKDFEYETTLKTKKVE